MAAYVFHGLDERKALRKALGFWYHYLKDQMSLVDFLKDCRRGNHSAQDRQGIAYYVVYRGRVPISVEPISDSVLRGGIG